MEAQAIGRFIVIREIHEEHTTSAGLIMGRDESDKLRYLRGEVLSVGSEATEVGVGDEIYYDKAAGHSMYVGGVSVKVIQIRDVVARI